VVVGSKLLITCDANNDYNKQIKKLLKNWLFAYLGDALASEFFFSGVFLCSLNKLLVF
jgi:hypothetical protein